MYKKAVSLILGIFLSLVLSFSIVKASEDGKLKIDIEIHKEKTSKGINYFEQCKVGIRTMKQKLSKLFLIDTNYNVNKEKEKFKTGENLEKNELFTNKFTQDSFVQSTRLLLFNSKLNIKPAVNYQMSIHENKNYISWQAVVVLSIGVIIMIFSVYQVFSKKERKF